MQVGDYVKHKWGAIHGWGLLVDLQKGRTYTNATVIWMTGRVMELRESWLEEAKEEWCDRISNERR
tara:strand:- start:777 stop:974 length:198 start_codon:yes stop_codon:yes gene_type:complete